MTRSHYALSAALAARGAQAAVESRPRGVAAVATTIATYQAAQALMSQTATAQMLLEQAIDVAAEALLNVLAFTTSTEVLNRMVTTGGGLDVVDLERLAESLIQDAGRAAESVAVTVRPDVHHVRFVNLPCCSRCALLAGRVYRWSSGFLRHPQCDCVMIPTTVASPLRQNPNELFEQGMIRGLSKSDTQAIGDGADLGRVVNIRRKAAGLSQSGRVLSRAGRPTPEAIYRLADGNRDRAVALLARHGYIR